MQLHSKKAHKVIQEVEKAVIGKDDPCPGIFPGAESEGTKADLYS